MGKPELAGIPDELWLFNNTVLVVHEIEEDPKICQRLVKIFCNTVNYSFRNTGIILVRAKACNLPPACCWT